MSTTWLFKTRQQSEAGKEILLREALANHMRSPRDRQTVAETLQGERPLEDILSFFSAFYLYNYQGLRLLTPETGAGVPVEKIEELSVEERRQLELEIRQLLGDRQRQELDLARRAAEFSICVLDLVSQHGLVPAKISEMISTELKGQLDRIPSDYSANATVDFINEITGWGAQVRADLYVKASGLKESSLSLREEMSKEHEHEAVEISLLKQSLGRMTGRAGFLSGMVRSSEIRPDYLNEVVEAIVGQVPKDVTAQKAVRLAAEIKLAVIDLIETEIDLPTTIESLEKRVADAVSERLAAAIETSPQATDGLLAALMHMSLVEVRSTLKRNKIDDFTALAKALRVSMAEPSAVVESPKYAGAEFGELERSVKAVERLEQVLEKQVKGPLRARGLRAADLDGITLSFLTKPRNSLVAMETQVLDELQKKTRVPSPEEMAQLLAARDSTSGTPEGPQGSLTFSEMSQHRRYAEIGSSVRRDLVWHLISAMLTNLTRVVETYLRSKQDLLRMRALLKSIWEDEQSEFQYVREEILVDVMSKRILEMKCVFPELDARTICIWMHARLSSSDLRTAETYLASSPSPVFEGIVELSLKLDGLEFDNYAIAFDVMQRFLTKQHQAVVAREQLAVETRVQEHKVAESKKRSLDALLFIYTKAHTVFRAISRVGTKGLEWSATDDAKCSNLLAFYVKSNRGRPVCQVCGEAQMTGGCPTHGEGHMNSSSDFDNLAVFLMRAISDIKSGLIGSAAKPFGWEEARSLVQREISGLKRSGKLTARTNIKELLPGEINYVVGPAIAAVIGKYFNESLTYAARGAGIA